MATDRRMQARMVAAMARISTPLIILGQDMAEAAAAFDRFNEEAKLFDVMGRIERGEREAWMPDRNRT